MCSSSTRASTSNPPILTTATWIATDPGNLDEFNDSTHGKRVKDGTDDSYATKYFDKKVLDENGNQVNYKDTDDCIANSHGTRVSSIVGGETYGVAKNVWLHPIRWCRAVDPSPGCVVSGLKKIRQIVQNGAVPAVVNISMNIPRLQTPQRSREVSGLARMETSSPKYDNCLATIRDEVQKLIDMNVTGSCVGRQRQPLLGAVPGRILELPPSDIPEAIVVGGVGKMTTRGSDSPSDENDPEPPRGDPFQCM